MTRWLERHPWETYLIIYILAVYIYNKVFRVRRLPILKDLLVYLSIAVGSLLLLFFQVKVGLPIVPSMSVAVLLMLILWIRISLGKRFQRK